MKINTSVTCYRRLVKLPLRIIFLIRLSCPQSTLIMLNVKSKSTFGRRDGRDNYVSLIFSLLYFLHFQVFQQCVYIFAVWKKWKNFKYYWIIKIGRVPDM